MLSNGITVVALSVFSSTSSLICSACFSILSSICSAVKLSSAEAPLDFLVVFFVLSCCLSDFSFLSTFLSALSVFLSASFFLSCDCFLSLLLFNTSSNINFSQDFLKARGVFSSPIPMTNMPASLSLDASFVKSLSDDTMQNPSTLPE